MKIFFFYIVFMAGFIATMLYMHQDEIRQVKEAIHTLNPKANLEKVTEVLNGAANR